MSEITVRHAHISDLPALLAIYNHVVRTSAATFDLEEQTLEQREKWFHKFTGRYPLIVAEQDGAVIGYASISLFREKQAYQQTGESSIYIHHEHHGKGLGKLLMNELIALARENDFHVLIAGITEGNDASVQLHQRLGFEWAGTFREVGYKFDQFQDVSFYQLILK
ncbi:N-acetyltransferase family protein [Brevibacillus fluminis]|uniref:GNAT family N-acetyltransferase n=1 Tax=Brevibacillus fluminis TaxID=511487 RepID=UPI003F8B15BF